MGGITFEEIMFTIMSAAQDTFMTYMGMEILAGKIEKKIEPVESDVVGIVGVAGDRVGYIMYATEKSSAVLVAKELLMMEEADDEAVRDAVGELTNNIAGVFKSKYHELYGSVALGLPLVVSGKIRPVSEPAEPAGDTTMNIQCKGVTIPFKSLDGGVSFRIMVYM